MENKKCGRVDGYYKSLKTSKEQCMKKSSCIGVSDRGCDEKGYFDLCDVDGGLAFSRQGSCVYEKKGWFRTSLNNISF